MSLYQSACYFQQEYGLSLSVDEIMAGIHRTIEHFYTHDVLPKPGVIEFLERMQKADIPMGIATASERSLIQAALRRCGMERFFKAIFTCNEVGYGKDEPIIFRKAMDSFGADRRTTFVFEDAYHAVQTAKADGFTVVAVLDDSEKRQDEIRKLSDCYLEDFEHTEGFWKFVSTW